MRIISKSKDLSLRVVDGHGDHIRIQTNAVQRYLRRESSEKVARKSELQLL